MMMVIFQADVYTCSICNYTGFESGELFGFEWLVPCTWGVSMSTPGLRLSFNWAEADNGFSTAKKKAYEN